MTNAVLPGLPPEVRQAHAEMTAKGFTGKVTLDYMHGEVVGMEIAERRRFSRETRARRETKGTAATG